MQSAFPTLTETISMVDMWPSLSSLHLSRPAQILPVLYNKCKMKFKLWLNIATFIAIALVVVFARHDIVLALQKLQQLNIWILLLMVPAQFFAFYAVAKVYYHFFKA